MSQQQHMEGVTDVDVLNAARALGSMRNVGTSSKESVFDGVDLNVVYDPRMKGHTSQTASSTFTPSLSLGESPSSGSVASEATMSPPPEDDDKSIARVSSMPFFGTAMSLYEQGKNSSRVVKYGAEMMEGAVGVMTKPVIDRLPVSQLGAFAAGQLDRFGGGRLGNSIRADDNPSSSGFTPENDSASPRTADGFPIHNTRGRKHLWLDGDNAAAPRSASQDSTLSSDQPASETAFSVSSGAQTRYQGDSRWHAIVHAQRQEDNSQALPQPPPSQEVQVVSRSKWQAVLLEAGGIGAAVSEESMKRLKYCLQWLQYANHHIDQQIVLLRSFIVSISPNNLGSTSSSTAVVPLESLEILSQVKRELINTIRQVVEVVSKYAGGALPEQARNTVRSFILMLPERWSLAARADADASLRGNDTLANGRGVSGGVAMAASTRVLTLATESLDMMRGVTSVFKESLDRAEAWVDRFQQLGLQRQQQQRRPALPELDAAPGWLSSRSPFETSAHRSTQYDGATTPQQRCMRDITPSEIASVSPPPSTRAASESEADTETEAGDECMSIASGDEGMNTVCSGSRRRKKHSCDDVAGMDLDS